MKKIVNKFIITIVTVITIFSMISCFNNINAAEAITDNPTFHIEGGETCAGYNIYVPITMETVKGISSADVKVAYYKELEFVRFEGNNEKLGNIAASVNKEEGELVVTFSNDEDLTGIIPLGNLVLKVPENAETGISYDVFIKEVNKIISKQEGELIGYYAEETTIDVIDKNGNLEVSSELFRKKIIIISSIIGVTGILIISVVIIFIVKKKKK